MKLNQNQADAFRWLAEALRFETKADRDAALAAIRKEMK